VQRPTRNATSMLLRNNIDAAVDYESSTVMSGYLF